MSHTHSADEQLIAQALQTASDTRLFRAGEGIRRQVSPVFGELFGSRPALIVADVNTFEAAGKDVVDGMREANHDRREPLVFVEPDLHAEYPHVDTIVDALKDTDAIPIAVGSGTLNDLTKRAAFVAGRPYLALATAASMDGYTAYGASIKHEGWKQTFECPAPVGVLADLEVIGSAPEGMNASGYADLLAKIVAGADWLVADALGVEAVNPVAWDMIHKRMGEWLGEPEGIRRNDPRGTYGLIVGLVMSGLGMQLTKSSRVASGADHQFSHLWDMQNHTHEGKVPSHGFKVGIGTLASAALYEQILPQALDELDVDTVASAWPALESLESIIQKSFDLPVLKEKALEETRVKHAEPVEIREQLVKLKTAWKPLRKRLHQHLPPIDEIEDRLGAAGCPTSPEQIGIPVSRLRDSYCQAYCVRRRFTVLDLAMRTQLLDPALESIFGKGGRWPISECG